MIMQHKCKVTVLETKVFSDLQEKYLADPQSAPYLLFSNLFPGDFSLKRVQNGRE